MATVTQRIRQIQQPRGGYVNPRSMQVTQFVDGADSPLDHKAEKVHASLVGLAVDYLARLANGAEPRTAFAISLMGARNLGPDVFAAALKETERLTPGRIDSAAVTTACKLAGYDVAYRVGPEFHNPDALTTPDALTVEHILVMVERSLAFFRDHGPITLDGFSFPGAFTALVTNGDGDFLTHDTVWDFKVSVNGPTKDHTLQLLMYLLMGQRSGQPEFTTISRLGVFNPRLNRAYRIAVAEIPAEVVTEVSRAVIGY
jgi:hypothetical protein